MNKRDLLIYRIATGLFTLIISFSAGMYFFNYEMVEEKFTLLQFPTYLIYPLAIAKILGLLAIWTNRSQLLKDFAYAGFIFNFLIAASAHLNIGDGESIGALLALLFVIVSLIYSRKLAGAH